MIYQEKKVINKKILLENILLKKTTQEAYKMEKNLLKILKITKLINKIIMLRY